MNDRYESPLSGRYASEYMLKLFSEREKTLCWRKLWLTLAEAEMELGLPITKAQVEELRDHLEDIDFNTVKTREAEVRHDVMAHLYAYGLVCPKAAGILHLGATSNYVKDNADLILYRDALLHLKKELVTVIRNLASFADRYKDLPTLGYTHFQPAQPVTVGKRAALWLQDFVSDYREIDHVLSELKFLGCRGATGTEASFLDLFDGDTGKIDEMNRRIALKFGFSAVFPVSGQSYPRKLDSRILSAVSALSESASKMATDIRLLQHEGEIEEPFAKDQIGSSAMAYKRNPIRSERICALSRYLMTDALNGPLTASSQWLERTLDDSANRRISMAEAFLAADAVLRISADVTDGLVVNEHVIEKNLRRFLPFIATENLLMEAVKKGGDRQKLHEIIRVESMEATKIVKDGGENDLLTRLSSHPEFGLSEADFERILNPACYTGRASGQVADYLSEIAPILQEEGAKMEALRL